MTKTTRRANPDLRSGNLKEAVLLSLFITLLWCGATAAAQPTKAERIGVIHLGGVLGTVADGLRAGLKGLGIEDGKQVVFDIQDLKGDAKGVESVVQKFERDQVKLIFTNTAPVTTAAMKASKNLPIVFAVGTDPVAQGYIQSFGRPGERLTGVQYLAHDLTGAAKVVR